LSCHVDEMSTNIGSSSAMMTSAESIDRGDRFPWDFIGGNHWRTSSSRLPGSISVFRSACGWSRTCWRRAGSSSAMNQARNRTVPCGDIRPDLRQQDPSACASVRRQVASRRGRDLDQRQEALVVARRRCGRFVAAWFSTPWFRAARVGAQRGSSRQRSSCASSSARNPARRA